jgi:poly(hydroxyalkanoate) depolymerase family esterase
MYMNGESRNIKTAATIYNGGFVQTFRRTVIGVCGASALLLVAGASPALAATPVEVTAFGTNPGDLKMFKYIPDGLPASAPLVVVMHGCTQNARTYAKESGWIQLADKLRLALAMPEQVKPNNQNLCFNWFQLGDITRDQGEALSIKQMVDKMKLDHTIDPKRVYVTGLSAGGGMTSVMLATYPDIFAGGGIVAGLPYGCAKNLSDALQCMNAGRPGSGALVGLPTGLPSGLSGGLPGSSTVNVPLPPGFCLFFPWLCPSDGDTTFTPSEWGDLVRRASSHTGPFPRVSIWHGSADTTVNAINATEDVEQWTNVHGIETEPTVRDTLKGFPHQVFKDASGNAVVEFVSVTGMSHGTPIDPGTGADQCGTPDQYVLDVNICSSFFIAKFWELVD